MLLTGLHQRQDEVPPAEADDQPGGEVGQLAAPHQRGRVAGGGGGHGLLQQVFLGQRGGVHVGLPQGHFACTVLGT